MGAVEIEEPSGKTVGEAVKSFFKMDRIRITRLCEIVQYALLFSILALLVGKAIDTTFAHFYPAKGEESIKNLSQFIRSGLVVSIQVVLSALAVFYMRKLIDIVPIFVNFAPGVYVPHWRANESSGEISLAIIFIAIQAEAIHQLEKMRKYPNHEL
jgi:hypothetical protein